MTTPLSEERLAEMQEWWSEWDGFEFTHPAQFFGPASRALKDVPALLDEVKRLTAWLRECDVAIGGDGSDESLLGLVYTCGAAKEALAKEGR